MNQRIIDISIWMDQFEFPGNQPVEARGPFNRVSGDQPEHVYDLSLCSQSGTHIQGPHYFLEDGKRIDEFPLEAFQGEAYLIDLQKRGEDTTEEELRKLLSDIDLENRILVLRTGHMAELIREKEMVPARRPGISLSAARYLCEEKKIKMIAIDSVGLESRETKNYEVNTCFCLHQVLILECIANLEEISGRWVTLSAFPLKWKGIEGTPCRAVIWENVQVQETITVSWSAQI